LRVLLVGLFTGAHVSVWALVRGRVVRAANDNTSREREKTILLEESTPILPPSNFALLR
jgi:hypothetical protein